MNHSSARAFGQKQPTPAGDIVLAIAAAVAVSLVVAMILGVLTLP